MTGCKSEGGSPPSQLMRKMRKNLFLASVLVLSLPWRAAAQLPTGPDPQRNAETVDDIRKNYQIHGGPFYVNPVLMLKELGVDTNVFNAAGEQLNDFTFTVTPQADVAVPMARRALLRTTVGTDLVYYQKYDSERSIDPEVTVRGELYAHRITLFGEGAYLNTRQRPNFEIDLRSRHVQKDVEAGVGARVSAKTSFEVAARRGEIRFDGDAIFQGTSLKQTLDRDSEGVSVTGRYKLSNLTTIATRYDTFHDRFALSPLRDTDSFRVMPGVEFKPRALINGVAYVGYRSFKPLSPLLPEYSGLVSQVGLSYTLLGSTTFGVTADRDITFSFEQLTPYFVDNSVGVFIRRSVGGKWDVLANAARHRYSYRSLATETLVFVPQRIDLTDNFGANLGYRLKRETRIGFGASYYTRSSNVAACRDYDGLRIGTTVTYGF